MDDCCADCDEIIDVNGDSISCNGVCGKKYHFACISNTNKHYKKNIVQFLLQIPNLHWYCNNCLPYTLEGAFSGVLHRLNECSVAIDSINKPIHQLQQCASNTSLSSSLAPTQTPVRNIQQLARLKQRQQQQQQSTSTSSHSAIASQTTTEHHPEQQQPYSDLNVLALDSTESNTEAIVTDSDSAHSIMIVDEPNEQFSTQGEQLSGLSNNKRKISPHTQVGKRIKPITTPLSNLVHLANSKKQTPATNQNKNNNNTAANHRSVYITRFKPITKPSDILLHVSKINGLEDNSHKIDCTKLVSNSKKSRNLSFVSFKLLVPPELYGIIVNPLHWPSSIKITDFTERQKPRPQPSQPTKKQGLVKKNVRGYPTPIPTTHRRRIQHTKPSTQQLQQQQYQMQPQLMYYPYPPHPYQPYQHLPSYINYFQPPLYHR